MALLEPKSPLLTVLNAFFDWTGVMASKAVEQ
jgi:hypothetical protein